MAGTLRSRFPLADPKSPKLPLRGELALRHDLLLLLPLYGSRAGRALT
jgi:hypothetical protein